MFGSGNVAKGKVCQLALPRAGGAENVYHVPTRGKRESVRQTLFQQVVRNDVAGLGRFTQNLALRKVSHCVGPGSRVVKAFPGVRAVLFGPWLSPALRIRNRKTKITHQVGRYV